MLRKKTVITHGAHQAVGGLRVELELTENHQTYYVECRSTDPGAGSAVLTNCKTSCMQHWPIWTALADKLRGSKEDLMTTVYFTNGTGLRIYLEHGHRNTEEEEEEEEEVCSLKKG